jgi:hypothetical protein
LSTWSHRGFDADRIKLKSRPEDCRQHPVLGEVYRVAIMKTGWQGNKTSRKDDKLQAKIALPTGGASSSGAGGLVPTLAGAASPQLALGDKSESDEGSSSSSSSSRHKKSKKSKKVKKSKKSKKEDRKRKREQSRGAAAAASDLGEFKCL